MAKIKYYKQETPYTCGAACLRMLLSRYRDFSEAMLAILSKTISLGTTPVDLARASEELGYEVDIYKHANLADLAGKVPCVVLINPGVILSDTPSSTGHFVVVKQVKGDEVIVNDPDMLFG